MRHSSQARQKPRKPPSAAKTLRPCWSRVPKSSPRSKTMAKASDTMLYLDGVSVAFDGFKAINNLSIIVRPAEMLAIIGPNGAGKTTMMDIITGKTRPDSGEVLFDGRTDLTK